MRSDCSICLEKNRSVIKSITSVDENNVKIYDKLRYIAPETDWLLDNYLICNICIELLNNACRFREQCLSVNEEHKQDFEFKGVTKHFHSQDQEYDQEIDNDHAVEYCGSLSSDDEKFKEEERTQNLFFICHDCGEKYVSKVELVKHITSVHNVSGKYADNTSEYLGGKYKTKEFHCLKCGRGYVLETTLNEHLVNCDGIRRHAKSEAEYQCNRCKKYYTTEKILKSHRKRCKLECEYNKNKYQCTKCNKSYISLKTLRDHCKRGCKKDKDNIQLVFCKTCDEYFKSPFSLKQHILSEHTTDNNYCADCLLSFDNKVEYDNHINIKHSSGPVTNSSTNKKTKGRATARTFTCEVCRKEFSLLKILLEHCMQIHSMEERAIRPYACDKCDNRFRSSTNLINHRLYHDRNRVNTCSFCGKSFITKNDLTAHEYTHYSHRNYKCEKCEKAFKTNTNLRTHQLIVHTDSSLWKYECHICNKRFPQKSNHDQHVRRHTGEKNFICPLCRKRFATKSELQEHISYHSNVRAYKCQYCGKEYRKKHTYDVHLTKIHGVGNAKIPIREKKHACHICPSRFYDRLKLARHLCIHSGLKPFPCYACEKKFTDKSYLKHHLKIVHNIIQEIKPEWVSQS